MEETGVHVQLIDTEMLYNAVGVVAEGWHHPEMRGCHLQDRAPPRPVIAGLEAGHKATESSGKPRAGQWGKGRRGAVRRAGRTGGEPLRTTRLGIEGCEFRCNQRAVEVVTRDGIASCWSLPLGRL